MFKKCKGLCKKDKSIDCFYIRKDTLKPEARCKECVAASRAQYYVENKKQITESHKKYQENHKEYRKINKEKIARTKSFYQIERRKSDPSIKIRQNISRSIRMMLRINESSKNGKSILKFLPYTIQELKSHIETQFEAWMTWGNQVFYRIKEWNDNDPTTWRWQIDHIVPQSDLPYTSMSDDNFRKCWALPNLRPLSAKQNLIDGTNKIRHKTKRK